MRIAAILALAALPALAQSPSTFRSSAEVTLEGADALHRLDLPFEAYRDARRDLADIRVFNKEGDAVPIAWAPDPGKMTEPARPIDLPIFPVRAVPVEGNASTEVTIRTADGTLVSVRGKTKPGSGPGQVRTRPGSEQGQVPNVAAILLDASKTNEPVKAIVFDWQARPGSELVTVRVEASDDLKSWATIGTAPLLRLSNHDGRALLQPRVEFPPRTVKYLRATWDAPAFEPTAARAEYVDRGMALPRLTRTAEATRGTEKPDDLIFDLGARLPVEALRLVPSQDNAVLVATFFVKNEPAEQWRGLTTSTFYRLQREGVESASPWKELGGRATARYWMARLAPGSSQGPLPKLEIQWTPRRLVFVKQGEGPFHLAFANAQATATALPIESVMPKYQKGAEELLKQARVGPVVAGPPPSRWDKLIGEMDGRRITLWAVLVLGVAALGFMAWRLSKQAR
jgi:hypothetical protein